MVYDICDNLGSFPRIQSNKDDRNQTRSLTSLPGIFHTPKTVAVEVVVVVLILVLLPRVVLLLLQVRSAVGFPLKQRVGDSTIQ